MTTQNQATFADLKNKQLFWDALILTGTDMAKQTIERADRYFTEHAKDRDFDYCVITRNVREAAVAQRFLRHIDEFKTQVENSTDPLAVTIERVMKDYTTRVVAEAARPSTTNDDTKIRYEAMGQFLEVVHQYYYELDKLVEFCNR